ncbi:MAG: alpha-beta hydrolase superfamily lysophospholipase [Myxococcota bacterium]|jgi:alpha-beta hydrolase superfamily lysophospholipase
MLVFVDAGVRTPDPENLSTTEKLTVLFTGVRIPRPAHSRTPDDLGLAYTTHPLTASDGSGLSAWLVPCPDCRGVAVLVHGYAASADQLLDLVPRLHDRGYAAVLIDQRGSGNADGRRTSLGYFEGADVAAGLDFARAQFPGQPAVLIGFSMGGASILRAVAAHGATPDAVVVEGTYADLMTTVGNRFALMGLPRQPGAALLVGWGSVMSGFDGFSWRPTKDAAAVRCPTLVLGGSLDTRAPPADAAAIAEAIPDATLRIVEGAGHASIAISHPADWAEALDALLAVL